MVVGGANRGVGGGGGGEWGGRGSVDEAAGPRRREKSSATAARSFSFTICACLLRSSRASEGKDAGRRVVGNEEGAETMEGSVNEGPSPGNVEDERAGGRGGLIEDELRSGTGGRGGGAARWWR